MFPAGQPNFSPVSYLGVGMCGGRNGGNQKNDTQDKTEGEDGRASESEEKLRGAKRRCIGEAGR